MTGEKGRPGRLRLHPFSRRFPAPAWSSGFTFTELIIIIAIIGILAAVAVLKGWGSTNPNALRVAIDQVITDMRFAQTMAMANSTNVWVTFTNNSRVYRMGTETRQLPAGVVSSVSQGFSFNMLGEYPETNDKYLTLSAGASTRRIRVYTVTSFVEEN